MNLITLILIYAIADVEGNKANAFADKGHSYGVLCITEPCVSDVNRRYGTKYMWPYDAGVFSNACDIFVKYTANGQTDFEKACIWNKGNNGKNKNSAKIYARKVMAKYYRRLTCR